ncbi:hypothetical protein ACD591_13440 [Rufibacter glacialis]|uniref:Uncharacterized protein n=1 Tax=Rufibacter glacialis TaxID=1259555 RepID=A0A5M8Q9A4_9BACT|nr:hypothetical protein [Rufibacter glacialis]KAA6431142.1 hypothetical protein FOE74_18785 [Rufibacter glacialis]GGK84342.1 hypothetical protein GCM10011405_35360 [Rufibacter glacialis]
MQDLDFPVNFTFEKFTFANRLQVTDVKGQAIYFVKQVHEDEFSESSLLNIDPFIDEVKIFRDSSAAEALYIMKAVPWKDFTASFGFMDKDGQVLGYVARSTWVPELAAHYHIFDKHLQKVFIVREGLAM